MTVKLEKYTNNGRTQSIFRKNGEMRLFLMDALAPYEMQMSSTIYLCGWRL